MKKTNFLKNTLLALTGTALFAFSAKADTITPTYSDLILGFRVVTLYDDDFNPLGSQGIGTDVNLMINLGAASQFYSPASSSFTLSSVVLADIVANYGANWNTRTDLVWGIIGSTSRTAGTSDAHAKASTIWATVAEETAGTLASTPQNSIPASYQNGVIASGIEPLFVGTAPFNGATSTANSGDAAVISASVDGSWSSLASDGSFGLSVSVEGSTAVADGSYSVLDLYELQPTAKSTAGTYLGSFGLSSDGVLTFSTDPSVFAVPEPSTYALMGIGLLLALKSRRFLVHA